MYRETCVLLPYHKITICQYRSAERFSLVASKRKSNQERGEVALRFSYTYTISTTRWTFILQEIFCSNPCLCHGGIHTPPVTCNLVSRAPARPSTAPGSSYLTLGIGHIAMLGCNVGYIKKTIKNINLKKKHAFLQL